MGRRGAEPEKPTRLGMRRAHNRAVRAAARVRQTLQSGQGPDAGRQFARWWRSAVTAMPDHFGHLRERAAHYWHVFIDRGGGHDR